MAQAHGQTALIFLSLQETNIQDFIQLKQNIYSSCIPCQTYERQAMMH
jgi:hypothetical protein